MTLRAAQKKLLLTVLLFAVASTSYWPVVQCGFVDYDDLEYVTNNPGVLSGLTARGITWAFVTTHAANWHPITWLSHMSDVQVYGLQPAGHHLTNLVLNGANTVLLFLLLSQMTATLWRSAFVAALFALHPTHVESIAWISERKDMLSTLFGLSALWAYAKYASDKSRAVPGDWLLYILSLLFFTLSLMSKPMLVTLPFLLLLLDFWPLDGIQKPITHFRKLTPLATEKLPYFLLAALSSAVTFSVQHSAGATVTAVELPFAARIANVLVAYVRYLGKLFWPENLAVFYPRPDHWPFWRIAGSALLLAIISLWSLRSLYNRRYLVVGWLWFLGTLVPVIGLVQVGEQAMADRYLYMPSIGIFIALSWGLEELVCRRPALKIPFIAAALSALAALFFLTQRQVRFWESTESLFLHTVHVTRNNVMAQEILAQAFFEAGKLDQAGFHASEALRLKPDFPEAAITYALVLVRQGRAMEALTRVGGLLRNQPTANARFALAQAYNLTGDAPQAITEYHEGLQLKPDNADALNNLAWIRATHRDPALRNGVEAVQLAQKACELTQFRQPLMVGTLAAAYAEAGRFPDAIATAQKARDLFEVQGKTELGAKNLELLELYQKGIAYHERPATNAAPLPSPQGRPSL